PVKMQSMTERPSPTRLNWAPSMGIQLRDQCKASPWVWAVRLRDNTRQVMAVSRATFRARLPMAIARAAEKMGRDISNNKIIAQQPGFHREKVYYFIQKKLKAKTRVIPITITN